MVDFRKLLTSEQREEWDKWHDYLGGQQRKYKEMTNDNLIASAKYCLAQMQGPRDQAPGSPVYDAAFYHAILPELFERLRKIDE